MPSAWIRPVSISAAAMPRVRPGVSTKRGFLPISSAIHAAAWTRGRRNRPASRLQTGTSASLCHRLFSHRPRLTAPGTPNPGDPGSAPRHRQGMPFPDKILPSSRARNDLPAPIFPKSRTRQRLLPTISAIRSGSPAERDADSNFPMSIPFIHSYLPIHLDRLPGPSHIFNAISG